MVITFRSQYLTTLSEYPHKPLISIPMHMRSKDEHLMTLYISSDEGIIPLHVILGQPFDHNTCIHHLVRNIDTMATLIIMGNVPCTNTLCMSYVLRDKNVKMTSVDKHTDFHFFTYSVLFLKSSLHFLTFICKTLHWIMLIIYL